MAEAISLRSRLAGYNWITGAPFTLSVTLMEIFWVFPWLLWFSQLPAFQWVKPPLSLFSLFLALGVSFVSSRYFINREWSLARVRLSIISVAVLTVFLIIRLEYGNHLGVLNGEWFNYIAFRLLNSFSHVEPIVLAIIFSSLLWWRGIRLGRSTLYANDIYRNFIIGVIALVILILVSGATSWTNFQFDMTSVWVHLTGFFFFGLLAMALANLKSIQERISAETLSPAMHRRWLSVLLVVIGGMVTTGIAIASAVSADFSYFLTGALDKASDFFIKVAYYIYLPIGYVIEWLYQMGLKIVNFFAGADPEPFEIDEIANVAEQAETVVGQGLPPEVILVLKWVFFALVAILIIYLLSKAVFRFMSYGKKGEIDEVHESLMTWDLFKSDLQLMLEKLRGLAQSRKSHERVVVLPDWYSDDFQDMLSMRQIYEVLLWETSRRNLGRYEYETPIEYAGRLNKKVPDGQEILDELTDLYIEARYGEHEFRTGILEYANFKWKSLRKLLRGPEDGQQL
ncbi:DUF4129 domain-containing protein [Chloroflexota bacterium]